ncbi:MAG: hypothetical protein ACO3FI_06270 [Cyclobacteriaceae bacterium]
MNKVLFFILTAMAIILFIASFSEIFKQWSEAMIALAIVLLLAALRLISPKPMTQSKN